MRFHAEHHFAASPTAVAALLVDPDFQTHVDLPDLARPEVIEHSRVGDVDVLRLRYEYVGHLDPIARRLLGGRELAWVQQLRLDRSAGRGQLTFAAEAEPDRLRGSADVELVAAGPGTRRRIAGELLVRVPVIGGTAERRIVPGLVRRLAVEAEALNARLDSQRS